MLTDQEEINNLYLNYKQYSEKYLSIYQVNQIKNLTTSEIENILFDRYLKITLLSFLSNIDKYQTLKIDCQNPKYEELFKNIKDMEKLRLNLKVQDNSKIIYIFEKSFWLNDLLKTLTNCSNLKEEINEILPYFKN